MLCSNVLVCPNVNFILKLWTSKNGSWKFPYLYHMQLHIYLPGVLHPRALHKSPSQHSIQSCVEVMLQFYLVWRWSMLTLGLRYTYFKYCLKNNTILQFHVYWFLLIALISYRKTKFQRLILQEEAKLKNKLEREVYTKWYIYLLLWDTNAIIYICNSPISHSNTFTW